MYAKTLQGHSRWTGHSEIPNGQSKEDRSLQQAQVKANHNVKTVFPRAQPWQQCLPLDLEEEIRMTTRT